MVAMRSTFMSQTCSRSSPSSLRPFLKAHRPPHGFLLVNLHSVNGGTKGISPFFHAIRTAARPVEMMLLRVLGGETSLKQNGLKRFCWVKELVAKERKAVQPAWHRGARHL